ncbi:MULTISPECIES: nucleoside 2-deoxyribosyltransferase [unclassified Acidiplasma]|nr:MULTISPECIES: nucleoside 2-deoxyribosyltransferase [unclassified Acidiplasma]KJE49683.1 hypothetical protein TZ01_00790 [Acidiplasma sp. MBA-1]WMT55753.1 MAG: nucleoside 2-deoxyribosyltransferase [Acidiplasma sp.]
MVNYDIYISAPLFNEMEVEFNNKVDAFVRNLGFTTYLPQRDGGEDEKLLRNPELYPEASRRVFERDVQALKNSRILLMLIDGRVPDEGACVELGMAYAYNKICIGFQTDIRKFSGMQNNLMIDYSFTYNIAHTWDELREILLKIKNLK